MRKIDINENAMFEFHVGINGISPDLLKGYFRLTINNIEYGFPVNIQDGNIECPIPPLAEMLNINLENGQVIHGRLDILDKSGGSFCLNPWSEEIEIVAKPKIVVRSLSTNKSDNIKTETDYNNIVNVIGAKKKEKEIVPQITKDVVDTGESDDHDVLVNRKDKKVLKRPRIIEPIPMVKNRNRNILKDNEEEKGIDSSKSIAETKPSISNDALYEMFSNMMKKYEKNKIVKTPVKTISESKPIPKPQVKRPVQKTISTKSKFDNIANYFDDDFISENMRPKLKKPVTNTSQKTNMVKKPVQKTIQKPMSKSISENKVKKSDNYGSYVHYDSYKKSSDSDISNDYYRSMMETYKQRDDSSLISNLTFLANSGMGSSTKYDSKYDELFDSVNIESKKLREKLIESATHKAKEQNLSEDQVYDILKGMCNR